MTEVCEHSRRKFGDHCARCGAAMTETLGERFVAEVLHSRPVTPPAVRVTTSRFPYERSLR